jgi:AcrR family transcriptional regulator
MIEPHSPHGDEELLGDDEGAERAERLLVQELGEDGAALFAEIRARQEERQRARRPDEGLRERKKRLTRQRISDIATTLCLTRGFDNVRVADVADIVGVSEKTVYNYFPTKESMVFDMADEGVERLVSALRGRDERESPTSAVVRLLREDLEHFRGVPAQAQSYVTGFARMLDSTPSLRAAWLELHARLTAVAADELAAWAGIDPRDPEPQIAAHALVGLQAVVFESRRRHVQAGLRDEELHAAVSGDLDRAARLLEIGLASFDLLARGQRSRAQLAEAARAAEAARDQVRAAIRDARTAWTAARSGGERAMRDAGRDVRRSAVEAQRAVRDAARAVERAARDEQRRAR